MKGLIALLMMLFTLGLRAQVLAAEEEGLVEGDNNSIVESDDYLDFEIDDLYGDDRLLRRF